MQAGTIELSTVDGDRAAGRRPGRDPGSPNRCGITAVQPMAATRRANSSTFGVMPGISAMTITAGPDALAEDVRVLPSWVKVVALEVCRSSSAIARPYAYCGRQWRGGGG